MTALGRLRRALGLVIVISLSAAFSAEDTPRCLPAPDDPFEIRLDDEQQNAAILRNLGPEVANTPVHRLTKFCVGLDGRW
jgi:hypothetical protein